ncbi:ATP-dependent RNA helicase SPB4 [Nakaseomyces bracarensis]|uniref:ATP-dependent RNA helicase SPB4 n=1 Tax=Nakaseomyces bracarensis TaxID=273131 RepID=UPI003872584F
MSKSLEWSELGYDLQPWIKNAIEIFGFDSMTPVQASTIPMFARNKDVVVESVTGSGKTVAFVIPILEKILSEGINNAKFKKGHFYSLILAPTRELSNQIQTVIDSFLEYLPEDQYPIKTQLLVGTNERSVRDDINVLLDERPQILIGTPGRVLEFLQSPTVKTTSCGMVVLDEADRLLDISFFKDVEKILNILPKQRRTGLFSATISSAGSLIFKTGLRNPVKITVNSKGSSAPTSLNLFYATMKPEEKFLNLLKLLNTTKFKKCIVYFPTCTSVTFFYQYMRYLQENFNELLRDDMKVISIHGKLTTQSRRKALDSFSQVLNDSVLLTTDVAARGIDIPDVDLVLQVDAPTDSDIFLHRCGRTGRANRIGRAILFLNEGREEDYVDFMSVKNIQLDLIDLGVGGKKIDSREFYDKFVHWILQDRANYDLSVKSYVAYIRYYTKHSASSIFRLQSLDYVSLGKMYGMFRLPRMPEITKYLQEKSKRKEAVEGLYDSGWLIDPPPIDMDKYQYMDKKREKARLEELSKLAQIQDKKKLKFELKNKNLSWSNKTMTKEERQERREKMELKRKAFELEIAAEAENDKSDEEVTEDWKDVIMKKKKKAKLSSSMQGSFDDL